MGTAQLAWMQGMKFVGTGASGHGVTMDAAPGVGGHDSAARPMEVLLIAVMGCTAMDVVGVLKKKRQDLQDFKIFATYERSPDHPKKYTSIHLEYVAYGDVDLKALERAVELSETKYCGAMATLGSEVEVTHSCRVETTLPVSR